jgi:xanthine dehydrogenase YagR molybdenum-binding subunit
VAKACADLKERIAQASVTSNGALTGRSPRKVRFENERLVSEDGATESLREAIERVSAGALEVYAEHIPEGLPHGAMDRLYKGQLPMLRGQKRKDATAFAYGAQFAEVRIHRRTCEIRAPRLVGAFAAGRIVNALTAHSQLMGGMIWGLSGALLEETELDVRAARYVNDNLSEYHIACNADVHEVDVLMLPERDDVVNPLGIKGLGEIGIVGMNAAIANAVSHATGRRIRSLPIRIEDLL